jgi:hypothetical protein
MYFLFRSISMPRCLRPLESRSSCGYLCVCLFCVKVETLRRADSPSEESYLPTVYRIKKLKKRPGSNKRTVESQIGRFPLSNCTKTLSPCTRNATNTVLSHKRRLTGIKINLYNSERFYTEGLRRKHKRSITWAHRHDIIIQREAYRRTSSGVSILEPKVAV